MSQARMRRVDEAVREVLADAIPRCVKDPRVGFVTVTDVNTSPDLRHAQVFVSVLGDEGERAAAIAGLSSAHSVLQHELSRRLRMKRTPTLTFHCDETALRAARLESLIERVAPPPDEPAQERS